MEGKGKIHTVVPLPLGRSTRYKLDRRLLGPYSYPECCEEISSLYLYWVRYPTPSHILYFYEGIGFDLCFRNESSIDVKISVSNNVEH